MKTLKDFKEKIEFFKYLDDNRKDLLELKKNSFKKTDPIGSVDYNIEKSVNKSNEETSFKGIVDIIGNTYNWMDSHNDVHIKGIFSNSIKQRKEKILHFHDHENKLTSIVGRPISILEKSFTWESLGVKKEGETTALVMKSNLQQNINPVIFEMYKDGLINQHSVGMSYINLHLAYPVEGDELSSGEERAKELWDKYYPKLGNPERADKLGYFWAVKEAKLIEISCVTEGSNEITPTYSSKNKVEPSQGTQKTEPSEDTQNIFIKQFFKS